MYLTFCLRPHESGAGTLSLCYPSSRRVLKGRREYGSGQVNISGDSITILYKVGPTLRCIRTRTLNETPLQVKKITLDVECT